MHYHSLKKKVFSLLGDLDIMQGLAVNFHDEEFNSESVKQHCTLLPDTSEWLD